MLVCFMWAPSARAERLRPSSTLDGIVGWDGVRGADYQNSINSITYEKVGQQIFPYDDYAFWRECPTVNCRLTPSAPEVAKVLMSFFSTHVRKNPDTPERMWMLAPSARSTKIGIVNLDAGVAHNPLKVLNQLWRDALGQVGRNVIECSRPKISD
jgi:hypothetical protein